MFTYQQKCHLKYQIYSQVFGHLSSLTYWHTNSSSVFIYQQKSYMPYLTLWDKISQNLAHLKGNSHKKFRSHRIFRSFYNWFYEEININYILLWFSQASYKKKQYFRPYWGSSKVMFKKISQNFVKSPLKVCLTSQILVHSLWHVWEMSPEISDLLPSIWTS